MAGDDWDESAALHVDPLDQVPADLVRWPSTAAGRGWIADDFDDASDGAEVAQ